MCFLFFSFLRAFKVTLTVTNCGIGDKLTTFEPDAKLKEVFKKSGVSLDSDVSVEKFGRAVVADMAYFSREYTRMAKRNCMVRWCTHYDRVALWKKNFQHGGGRFLIR